MGTFTAYIQEGMRRATYEIIENPEPYYGHIPDLQGVYAVGATLEACRDELQSVLEDWILVGLRLGHTIPPLGEVVIPSGKFEPSEAA